MATKPLERARRSLEGLSVGDALGERFFGPEEVVRSRIAARHVPAGPWRFTDDTVMALSVLDELTAHGRIDRDSLAQRFGTRYVADPHRGYGGTAHDILSAVAAGARWQDVSSAVFDGAGSMGNGAAMRAGPLGAWFADDLDRLVLEARASAEVTHAHPEGQAGAIAVALAAAWACGSRDERLLSFVVARTPTGATREGLVRAMSLPMNSSVASAAEILGSGQSVISSDTVPFALWCAARHHDDFTEAFWATVSGLGDRDTTCAIVGSITALSSAPGTLPPAWLAARERLN